MNGLLHLSMCFGTAFLFHVAGVLSFYGYERHEVRLSELVFRGGKTGVETLVVRSSGYPALDRAARVAMGRVRYLDAKGAPADEGALEMTFRFQLKDWSP